MEDSLKKDGELSLKYSPDLTLQGIEAGRQTPVNTSYINTILNIGGVREVTQRIWGYGNIGNTLIVIVGVDLNTSKVNPAAAYPLEAGSFLDAQKNNTIVIGRAVADLLGTKVGETLSILSESNQIYQYTIAGIFNSESSIYSADMILMNLNDARAFFKVPDGKATDIIIYLTPIDPSSYTSYVNFMHVS
jgi:ABC-type lipoprotein release transport system permease subunit